jgi:hypothetical protein
VPLPLGARIEARRGEHPVRFARLHTAPFTDRLVAKFDLPVRGWRGAFAPGDTEFDPPERFDQVVSDVHGEPVRDTPSA